MPSSVELAKAAIDDFKEMQRYMLLARIENPTETYAELKKKYFSLKAILDVCGVNLTNIDEIKEKLKTLFFFSFSISPTLSYLSIFVFQLFSHQL